MYYMRENLLESFKKTEEVVLIDVKLVLIIFYINEIYVLVRVHKETNFCRPLTWEVTTG